MKGFIVVDMPMPNNMDHLRFANNLGGKLYAHNYIRDGNIWYEVAEIRDGQKFFLNGKKYKIVEESECS